jgi:hypothetical protein
MQAWHVDTPLPHVYVNILYLDENQLSTEILKKHEDTSFSKCLDPPMDEPLDTMSEFTPKWREYLKEK